MPIGKLAPEMHLAVLAWRQRAFWLTGTLTGLLLATSRPVGF